MKNFHACTIAGTHSSAGKTTWSLALMQLARRKNLTVQPFKCGPDYIDPSFHTRICLPRKSRNLDRFFLGDEKLKQCFQKNSAGADLAVIEGVMGLYDGKSLTGEGSTAQIAKQLNAPVLLVIDGAGLSNSAAAIALGFQKYDPELKIVGIVFNRVNRESHFNLLKNAVEAKTGLPCLGYLPKEAAFHIPERHLGLTTAAETENLPDKIQKAAALLEKSFDWEKFLTLTQVPHPEFVPVPAEKEKSVRVAVAKDKAFSFYYEDNFDLLREAGAEIIFFSPLRDNELPLPADLLYLGGGFPEIYGERLAENKPMMESVRRFYQAGGFIYAECGGLIYLTACGLLPGTIRMTDRLQNFGYHEIQTAGDSFLFPAGKKLRSHEFHYSEWITPDLLKPAYQIGERKEGFCSGRLFASYQHLHFGSDPSIAPYLIKNISGAAALKQA